MKTALLFVTFASTTFLLAQQTADARGFIGLALADIPDHYGALVQAVKPGGPADRSGVQPGDVIVAVNRTPVDGAATMSRIIGSMLPGQTADLSIVRGSGSAAQRRTVAVVLGSATGGDGAAADAATNEVPARSRGDEAANTTLGTLARPISVPGYVRLTDPLEQAFTVDVPSGWQSVGGLARRSALQINPYVRSLSPDKMTYLMMGEPTMPTFAPPSQMGNAIGHPEGTLYDSGLGGLTLVLHYLPGADFARLYGQSALQGLCPTLKFADARNRPDLARKADAQWPTVIPSVAYGGEARFTCVHNKQEMEARVEAVTRTTRDNILWAVILLQALIAPRGQADKAEEILTHMAGSMLFTQTWIQRQNNLSQQAAAAINARMQETFRQERAFIQKLNSVDENFESMDEIVSGFSTYHDAQTGNNYSLSNTNPNKWIDPSTGRIISTPTNTRPAWAPAYQPLTKR